MSDAGKSYMDIEWTNQHGCGGNEANDPHKQNCNLVLQYMCQDEGINQSKSNIHTREVTMFLSVVYHLWDCLSLSLSLNDFIMFGANYLCIESVYSVNILCVWP